MNSNHSCLYPSSPQIDRLAQKQLLFIMNGKGNFTALTLALALALLKRVNALSQIFTRLYKT